MGWKIKILVIQPWVGQPLNKVNSTPFSGYSKYIVNVFLSLIYLKYTPHTLEPQEKVCLVAKITKEGQCRKTHNHPGKDSCSFW